MWINISEEFQQFYMKLKDICNEHQLFQISNTNFVLFRQKYLRSDYIVSKICWNFILSNMTFWVGRILNIIKASLDDRYWKQEATAGRHFENCCLKPYISLRSFGRIFTTHSFCYNKIFCKLVFPLICFGTILILIRKFGNKIFI